MAIRIDLLITDLDYGGAESQVVDLLSVFSKDPDFVFRLISIMPPVAFVDRVRACGVEVISLDLRRKWLAPLAFFKLLWLVISNRTRLVHGHMVHANFMARACRLVCPWIRVISSAHSSNEGSHLREILYALTDPLSHLNTNVSQSAVDQYVKVGASPAGKIRAVYNGIDTERFRPASLPPADVFRWVAVGRLEEVKGYDVLLAAAALLKERGRRFRLRVVGRGTQEARLKDQCRRLGLDDSVVFWGISDAVSEAYQASDAFVLASYYEGYGLVVAEAMACGLPVVATDCGGPAEIVGDVGMLVPVQDAGALADGMARVMELSPQQRQVLGARGRARVVECFSLQSIADGWKATYRELLGK